MAEKKVIGTPFQKGNQFGKRSSNKLTLKQKNISKKLKSIDGKLMVAMYLFMDYGDLKKELKEKKVTSLELLIMRMIEKGIAKADIKILTFIFDLLGWTKDASSESADKIIKSINLNYKV